MAVTAARPFSRRDTLALAVCVTAAVVARVLPDPLRDPVAASLRRTVVAPLVLLQRDAELSRRAWLSRREAIVARDSIVLQAMALPAVERENELLRSALGLGRRLRWGFIPAEVLQGQQGEEYTVMLSAGARAGVAPFSPVVAADGLVGMVKTVDPTMSIAILWSHPDFRVSAMSDDSSAYGIAAAHLGDQPARNLLELRGVPVRSTLKPGTLIRSSGLGGVHPRGIPIGTVIAEDQTRAEQWSRTYLLRPAAAPADIDAVMILRPERAAAGVEKVWESQAAVDTAVRRIVAAGDSIARADSLARAAARAAVAAADSVRRAVADSARAAAAATQAPPAAAPPPRP